MKLPREVIGASIFAYFLLVFMLWCMEPNTQQNFCNHIPGTRFGYIFYYITYPSKAVACWLTEDLK